MKYDTMEFVMYFIFKTSLLFLVVMITELVHKCVGYW